MSAFDIRAVLFSAILFLVLFLLFPSFTLLLGSYALLFLIEKLPSKLLVFTDTLVWGQQVLNISVKLEKEE